MALPGRHAIADEELDALVGMIEERFGIQIPLQKRVLLSARLTRWMREAGYVHFDRFYWERLAEPTPELERSLASLVSTNHTYFWREPDHFEFFRDEVVGERVRAAAAGAPRDLRTWCAAASTGEEPYTLEMMQREALGVALPRWKAGVLATDLDAEALTIAARGVYSADNAERLPQPLRSRYLERHPEGYAVSGSLRGALVFRTFNLIANHYVFRAPFHAIFCRNVLIYFSRANRDAVIQRLYGATAPGGYLFLSHAETLGRGRGPFKYVQPGVYQRAP